MHTNSTSNYQFPQWIASDVFEPIGDLNPAFSTLDRVLKETNTAGTSALDFATTANQTAASANEAATKATADVATLTTEQQSQEARLDSLETNYNNLSAEVTQVKQTVDNLPDYESRVATLEQENTTNQGNITQLFTNLGGLEFQKMTQAEFDALETVPDTTITFVTAG